MREVDIYHNRVTSAQIKGVGNAVYEAAWEIWRQCFEHEKEAWYDFCVQNTSELGVIFGGYNRLKWRPLTGWTVEPSHCTPGFLERFEVLRHKDGFETLRPIPTMLKREAPS